MIFKAFCWCICIYILWSNFEFPFCWNVPHKHTQIFKVQRHKKLDQTDPTITIIQLSNGLIQIAGIFLTLQMKQLNTPLPQCHYFLTQYFSHVCQGLFVCSLSLCKKFFVLTTVLCLYSQALCSPSVAHLSAFSVTTRLWRGLMRLPSQWVTDYINSQMCRSEQSGSRAPLCRQRLDSRWCSGGLWRRNEAGGWHGSHTPTPSMTIQCASCYSGACVEIGVFSWY